MSSFRIRIEGELGSITYRGFLAALDDWFAVLRDLDVAISGLSKGSLEWLVTGLNPGSLVVDLESRSFTDEHNYGPAVAKAAVDGVSVVDRQGMSPPYLSEAGLKRVQHLCGLIGREGATGFTVSHLDESAELTPRASNHIADLLRVQRREIGSVEGRLETVSVHGKPKFIVYLTRTRKAVSCSIPSTEWLQRATEAMQEGKRVNVTGMVQYNGRGEPMRVEPEAIRALREESELPTIEGMSGKYPDLTGELSTARFIREVRGG